MSVEIDIDVDICIHSIQSIGPCAAGTEAIGTLARRGPFPRVLDPG